MAKALARRQRRGLSWTELSAETGIPTSTLQWWHRRLRDDATRDESQGGFVRVAVAQARVGPPLAIVLRNGRRLIVPMEFDSEHLRRVIAVVDSEC